MKKTIVLGLAIFISFAAGCEKNEAAQKTQEAAPSSTEPHRLADNFQQADDKITALIDQIENPELAPEQRQKVLCQDFPKVYQNEYVPALLALNSKDTSQAQLLDEMRFSLNYYQQQLNISCT